MKYKFLPGDEMISPAHLPIPGVACVVHRLFQATVTMSERAAKPDLVTRDYTIHLAKYTHKITFKKKAPRAIKEIKKFAA
eukprot:scaffold10722_cov308-Chaetoceros_neogracile.AAC.1